MIGSINITLKRLDAGYYVFFVVSILMKKEFSAESGKQYSLLAKIIHLLKAFAKERKKYLLDKTPILFASSVILT
jgi:hypothetical protein